MNTNISIEARMTSSRLPGKVLMPICGIPTLELMIKRIQKAKLIDNIIVATTINKEDDEIVNWCEKNHIDYFRGSENNVYDRVLKSHQKFKTDIIVELTGDCPLLDPQLIDDTIQKFKDNEYDYVATSPEYPLGMAVQVYTLSTLESVSTNRELEYQDREHVTPYLYTSGKYNISYLKTPKKHMCNKLSVTLDTQEDFEVIENVCKNFDTIYFTLEEIVLFAKANPEKVNMNHTTKRKGLN